MLYRRANVSLADTPLASTLTHARKQLDTYRMLLVLTHRTLEETDDSAEKALARVEAVPESEREDEVRNLVHDQVKAILAGLSADLKGRPVNSAVDFRVAVRTSSIPGARNGIFLEQGACRAGQVLLFYPGVVIRPHHIARVPGFPRVLDPYNMLTITHDGAMINPYNVSAPGAPADSLIVPGSDGELVAQRIGSPQDVCNRLALAHLVNHSGAARIPNVASVDYAFPANVPEALAPLVPNLMWEPPKTGGGSQRGEARGLARRFVDKTNALADAYADKTIVTACEGEAAVPSQVLVSLAPIATGDEVLLDYRFNPAMRDRWPEWYEPHDEEAARRRWSGNSIRGS
jgi:hypothetical protein